MSYRPIPTVKIHWQSIMPTHKEPVKIHELSSLSYCKYHAEYEKYDLLIRAKRITNCVTPSEPLIYKQEQRCEIKTAHSVVTGYG